MNVGMQHIAIKAPFEMQHVVFVLLLPQSDKGSVFVNMFADDGVVYFGLYGKFS